MARGPPPMGMPPRGMPPQGMPVSLVYGSSAQVADPTHFTGGFYPSTGPVSLLVCSCGVLELHDHTSCTTLTYFYFPLMASAERGCCNYFNRSV